MRLAVVVAAAGVKQGRAVHTVPILLVAALSKHKHAHGKYRAPHARGNDLPTFLAQRARLYLPRIAVIGLVALEPVANSLRRSTEGYAHLCVHLRSELAVEEAAEGMHQHGVVVHFAQQLSAVEEQSRDVVRQGISGALVAERWVPQPQFLQGQAGPR